jgi:YVTN family beta-propeller protein
VSASPDGSRVYIANYGDNTISVINTATNTVTATIPVCKEPAGLSVSPDGSKVYVAYYGCDTVNVINAVTDTISATIPVCSMAYCLCVSPDGNKVFVANEDANNISVINTATNTISATIPVGSRPVAFGNFISTYGTGIAPQNMVAAGIDIFPNPASEEIRVIGNQCSVSGVEVFNLLGEKIYNLPITDNRLPITVKVADFPAGVYMVKVQTENGVEVKKFIKE